MKHSLLGCVNYSDTPQTVSEIAERDKTIQVLEEQIAEFKISMQEFRDDRAEKKSRESKLLEIVKKLTLMLSALERSKTVWSRLKEFFSEP